MSLLVSKIGLETINIVLDIHFRFGSPYGFPVGDNLVRQGSLVPPNMQHCRSYIVLAVAAALQKQL